MVASDIYTIAKALSKEEFIKLSDMLRSDIKKSEIKLKKKKKYELPDFTKEDGLRYLLENHIRKNKKI
ncbi:hypothetical protein [Polaribacter butkevichii]|uniref:hypothetical protein n=1 Tax=Polaribacter butkevichii TaxID=218490 RepID=UPI000CF47543|nr:hypothetical protein [Polaribacter butkevichii]